eukprot:769258_1
MANSNMRISVLLLMMLLILSLSQQWELVFDDEFEGTELNQSNWNNTRPQPASAYPGQPQLFLAANTYLQNGSLVIETKYDPTYDKVNNITYPYTSGVITSQNKFSFTYGRVEIRAKLPSEQFKHASPCIWLQ